MHITLLDADDNGGIGKVARLAQLIWNEHFPKIIGQSQVDYMVETFQSNDAIRAQISDGYRYFLIRADGVDIGYTALVARPERACMQISKLYLLPDWRGRGVARAALAQIGAIARRAGLPRLYLTVNKYNHSALAAYYKLGFVRTGELVADIGNGYVMDDYEMEMEIGGDPPK